MDGNYLEKKNATQYKEHLAGLFQQSEFNCGLEDNTESWFPQMTFKALYSPQLKLEDTTSLSVTDALALFVKAKLTEPDLGSPPYEGVVQFWFCSLVFIFPVLIFLCSLAIIGQTKLSLNPINIEITLVNHFSVFKLYIIQESKMRQES